MDDYFVKWYPTLRDAILVGVREPIRLILEQFPKDWERWLQSTLPLMETNSRKNTSVLSGAWKKREIQTTAPSFAAHYKS